MPSRGGSTTFGSGTADPFTWAKCPSEDSYFWCRLEFAKGFLYQKIALVHLSNEKLALAVASYKQANDIWPSLTAYGVMGGLQAACGLTSDAKATYRTCIERTEIWGARNRQKIREEMLAEIQRALRELS